MRTGSSGLVREAAGWLGPLYLDASALLKLYLSEPGSEELNAAVEGRRDLLVSDLAITEIVSALARRRREGALSGDNAAEVRRTVLAHVESGLLTRLELVAAVHREAERYMLTLDVPLRAADALHLALATGARAGSLVTYDARLAAAAHGVGLAARPG